MSKTTARSLSALLSIVFLAVPGHTQEPNLSQLNGELKAEGTTFYYGYVAELEQIPTHQAFARADVDSSGGFAFQRVPYGDYVVRIVTYHGELVEEASVFVNSRTQPVTVRLRQYPQTRPTSGKVSMRQLQHPPAKKAKEAALFAAKLSEGGNYAKAADELETAVRISPDFAEAWTNLAVQHMRMGQYEKALQEVAEAMRIANPNPIDLTNQGYALASLGRLEEGILSERAALRLDPDCPGAHFVLGTILAARAETLQEAAEHLTVAAQTMPAAKSNLAKVQAVLRSREARMATSVLAK